MNNKLMAKFFLPVGDLLMMSRSNFASEASVSTSTSSQITDMIQCKVFVIWMLLGNR